MEQLKEGFGIFKWFIELNKEAKVVVALLSFVTIGVLYQNHSLNSSIDAERLRYDVLNDKYTNSYKYCNIEKDSLNAIWTRKYEAYRNLKDEESKELNKTLELRYNKLELKLEEYEKSN